MNFIKAATILSLVLLLPACEEPSLLFYNPEPEVSFEVEQTNSENDYKATVEEVIDIESISNWRNWGDSDTVTLIRELSADLLLSSGDTVSFGLWMIKYEAKDFIELHTDSLTNKNSYWAYKDPETEIESFYGDFKEARIIINNNALFIDHSSEYFQIQRSKELIIEDRSKVYLEIQFSGTAYGWYDPSGEFQEVYTFSNGLLKGVLF